MLHRRKRGRPAGPAAGGPSSSSSAVEVAAGLIERHRRLLELVADAHECECGCRQPGSAAVCVSPPWWRPLLVELELEVRATAQVRELLR